jgi:alkylation response protein AidB-like acyl-CoA dehydrogenase
LSYTRQRRVFGKKLIEHGLMRAVLVDLALESEAALALGMRLAEAFEQDADDRHLAWKRIMTPVRVGNSILLATDIESGDARALCERSVA